MITGIFGLTGAGKSTLLAWCADRALKNKPIYIGRWPQRCYITDPNIYERVYTNFEMSGCYKLDFNALGRQTFENSLLLIDEISLLCDSRNYKEFDEATKYFFTHHRKYCTDIIWCGQSYMDTDVKIRRLTKQFCFVEAARFGRSRVTPIAKILEVSPQGQIVEGFAEASRWGSTFLNRRKYYALFDSFERRQLRPNRATLWLPPQITPSQEEEKEKSEAL